MNIPKKNIESSGMDQNRVKTWDPPCFGGMNIWMLRAGKGFLIHSHLEAVEIVSHCLNLVWDMAKRAEYEMDQYAVQDG